MKIHERNRRFLPIQRDHKAIRACIVCDSDRLHHLSSSSPAGFIWRCTLCGGAHTQQRIPVEAKSTYDAAYFDGVNRYNDREAELQKHFGLLLDLVKHRHPSGRLLDVGCGTGLLLTVARTRGYTVEGIEFSAYASRFAREHHALKVTTGTISSAVPSLNERFDVITLNHVLEHLQDPRAELVSLRGLLAPGGILVIGVPNFASAFRLVLGSRWPSLLPSEHLWHFTPDSLTSLLRKCGLMSVEMVAGDNHTYETKLPSALRWLWPGVNALTRKRLRSDSIVTLASLVPN